MKATVYEIGIKRASNKNSKGKLGRYFCGLHVDNNRNQCTDIWLK